MEIITSMEQGSQEWLDIRLGKITASRMKDVLSNGRGGNPSKTAESYMIELIAERLTGESKPFFENDAMRWGTETEPQARAMYELETGNDVEEVAFIIHNEFIGVSPDGLIGADGMLEIKAPTTTTQIKRALTGSYHSEYKAQVQSQMWVAEREWCDFLSFEPRLEGGASFLIERVYRDDDYIRDMGEKVGKFINEMKSKIDRILMLE